jgi:hypothetical protein
MGTPWFLLFDSLFDQNVSMQKPSATRWSKQWSQIDQEKGSNFNGSVTVGHNRVPDCFLALILQFSCRYCRLIEKSTV